MPLSNKINTHFANSTSLHATLTNSLPANGWIKPCLICSAPTSKCYLVFEELELYNCYFCKDCLQYPSNLGRQQYTFIIQKDILLQKRLGVKYGVPGR
jgi:hypothetical protein